VAPTAGGEMVLDGGGVVLKAEVFRDESLPSGGSPIA
jgi:hypothetical protein